MKVLLDFLKKYWFYIVSFLGAILAGFAVAKNRQDKKETKEVKKDIKKTDTEIKDVKKLQEKLQKQKQETEFLLEVSKTKAQDLEKKSQSSPKKNTDVNKAKIRLKDIAKKKS